MRWLIAILVAVIIVPVSAQTIRLEPIVVDEITTGIRFEFCPHCGECFPRSSWLVNNRGTIVHMFTCLKLIKKGRKTRRWEFKIIYTAKTQIVWCKRIQVEDDKTD